MADFDNLFRKKTDTTSYVPKIVLDKLNQGLPVGLEYKILDDGNLILTPNGISPITVSGIEFICPKQYLDLLGDQPHSLELLQFYSDNTQTPIQIIPTNGSDIIVNGVTISKESFIKNPFASCKIKNGMMYMLPTKFSKPFEITVGDGNIEKILKAHRSIHNSIKETKYETEDNECLKMTYYLNNETRSIRFFFTLNTKKARTVDELIDSIKIFYAFRKGKGFIFGKEQSSSPVSDSDTDTFNLKFWQHVKALEKVFNIKFSIKNKKISNETSWKLEELYQMVVLKNIIRERKTLSKLFVNVGADDQLEEGLNKQIYLEFAEPTKEKLLGIELNFFLLKGLFNAKIDQIKEEINGKKVSLVPFDDKQIYITKLAFISEEDVIKYQSVDKNTYIPHFEKAKTLMEIIADEENDR